MLKAGLASVIVLPILYLGLNNPLFPQESTQSCLQLGSEIASWPMPVGFEDPEFTALLVEPHGFVAFP